MGLVELLVALAISAALLTAVAVATDSSFRAYAINEEQSKLMNRCRLVSHRLNTYIRVCKEHSPITQAAIDNFSVGAIVTDTGISMFTEDETQLDFYYDATAKEIKLTQGASTVTLISGVESFQVKMEPMQSPTAIKTGSGYDLLRRATITISLKTSGNSADLDESEMSQDFTISSSVMPRRNSW